MYTSDTDLEINGGGGWLIFQVGSWALWTVILLLNLNCGFTRVLASLHSVQSTLNIPLLGALGACHRKNFKNLSP